MPYVVMSKEQGEVFREYDRNEKKHEMRRMRYHDMEGYDEGTTENIKGIYSNDVPEDAVMGKMEHERFKEAIEKLPTVQKRSILYFYHGLLEGEIARAEGVTQQMVAKSLDQAMRNLKAFLKL